MVNPHPLYNPGLFAVEIDQITEATFAECSGLQIETEVFEWEEGGNNNGKVRLAGRTKYSNLVLKRGLASFELWDWYQKVVVGTPERRTIGIVLYNPKDKGVEPLRWSITGALPIKWVGPTLKAGATEVAIETLEVVHHGLTRKP
jgi:phage tail-like protein